MPKQGYTGICLKTEVAELLRSKAKAANLGLNDYLTSMLSVSPQFMQTLEEEIYNGLNDIAKNRGISVQELIRAVIIPEWLAIQKEKGGTK